MQQHSWVNKKPRWFENDIEKEAKLSSEYREALNGMISEISAEIEPVLEEVLEILSKIERGSGDLSWRWFEEIL